MSPRSNAQPSLLFYLTVLLALAALLAMAGAVLAAECGDVNADGTVGAVDALMVLEKSTGMPIDLECPIDEDPIAELEARIEALESLLASFTMEEDTLVLSGVNLQIVSGSGSTGGLTGEDCRKDKNCDEGFCTDEHMCATTNGLGNLIIGYDEDDDDEKTGSHNLVIGPYHSYTGFGAIVAGNDNRVEGASASVTGGQSNAATGDYASVAGGRENEAEGLAAAIAGGSENNAEGDHAAICGGNNNFATGTDSSVGGGHFNRARGSRASVGGGFENIAAGVGSSVCGGGANLASGRSATVLGGSVNTATAQRSVVVGGRRNSARGSASVVLGRDGFFTNSEVDLVPRW